MTTVKAVGPSSRGALRNGMPGLHDYAYRGVRVDLRYECEAGCGRRMDVAQVCAVCRGYYDRADGKARPGEYTRRREARQ